MSSPRPVELVQSPLLKSVGCAGSYLDVYPQDCHRRETLRPRASVSIDIASRIPADDQRADLPDTGRLPQATHDMNRQRLRRLYSDDVQGRSRPNAATAVHGRAARFFA